MIIAALKINKAKGRFTTTHDPFGGGTGENVTKLAGFVGDRVGMINRAGGECDCSYWIHTDKSLYVLSKRNPDGMRR